MRVVKCNEAGLRIGQDHPRSTIPDDLVRLLRDLHEFGGWGLRRLSIRFNIPKSTVQKVCAYTRRVQVFTQTKRIDD